MVEVWFALTKVVPAALSKNTSYTAALATLGQLNTAVLPSLHVLLPFAGAV